MDNSSQGGFSTGLWSQAIQALNRIATALGTPKTSAIPGSIVTTAGQPSGSYVIVTANGTNYAVPLYNLS